MSGTALTVLALADLAALGAAPQHDQHAFSTAQIEAQLSVLPEWGFQNGKIVKTFRFANYYETMAFVNVVAAIAHKTDHHPDLSVHYNRCEVAFNTHDVDHGKGGISVNDFICAARIETVRQLL
jgi:4a-hydroxytetrahydrobiopterin dehydratase